MKRLTMRARRVSPDYLVYHHQIFEAAVPCILLDAWSRYSVRAFLSPLIFIMSVTS
jgi:hypothetical protein